MFQPGEYKRDYTTPPNGGEALPAAEARTVPPVAGEVKTNPITGAKWVEDRRKHHFLQLIPAKDGNPGFNARPEIDLRWPVVGLRAFRQDDFVMAWEWITDEPKDAADAVDAQCRAGWNDDIYGFFAFRWARVGEKFKATWESWVSCE